MFVPKTTGKKEAFLVAHPVLLAWARCVFSHAFLSHHWLNSTCCSPNIVTAGVWGTPVIFTLMLFRWARTAKFQVIHLRRDAFLEHLNKFKVFFLCLEPLWEVWLWALLVLWEDPEVQQSTGLIQEFSCVSSTVGIPLSSASSQWL